MTYCPFSLLRALHPIHKHGPQPAPKQNVTAWTIKAAEPTLFALQIPATIAVADLYRYRLYTLHSLSKQILLRSIPSIASGLLVIHEHHCLV